MTREELEHAIRAACDVSGDEEVWVFGSQAILGEYPDAPDILRQSMEADVTPKNFPDRVDRIDGALGELSQFHRSFGFYVHGVRIESAKLPAGWRERAIPVSGRGPKPATGWCLEAHDLACSKLAAFRAKDREFVRAMLVQEMLAAETLIQRLHDLPVDRELVSKLESWIVRTVEL